MGKQRFLQTVMRLASLVVDYPLRPIENQVGVNSRDQKIPPIVYQTWEENAFGRRHLKSMKKFRSKNANLDFVLMTRADRDQFMKSEWDGTLAYEAYRRAAFGPLKVDIFRYCLLFRNGGYYFDISKGVDTSLSSLHDSESTELISFEGNKTIPAPMEVANRLLLPDHLNLQWGMGFTASHPILDIVIRKIGENFDSAKNHVFENPKLAILEISGPGVFTEAVREYLLVNVNSKVTQLGIDFGGHGIYSLPGSGVRHHRFPSYANAKNERLFD